MFKFGQKEVTAKDFHRQKQMTDIFTIDVNKVVVSDKVSFNNGKDCCCIVDYQVDEALLHFLSRRLKIYLVMACCITTKTLPIQCHLMFLRLMSGCLSIKRFGMRLSRSCLKN